MRGEGGSCGVSANEYSCAHGAQINFGDLSPYLTFEYNFFLLQNFSALYTLKPGSGSSNSN
jgi:hypothetical protein